MREGDEIARILPHRYPFLLVDRVLEFEPERRLVAVKNVTLNEPHFAGHFPGRAIMRRPREAPRQSEVHGRTSTSPARSPERISSPSGMSGRGSSRPRCTGTSMTAPAAVRTRA